MNRIRLQKYIASLLCTLFIMNSSVSVWADTPVSTNGKSTIGVNGTTINSDSTKSITSSTSHSKLNVSAYETDTGNVNINVETQLDTKVYDMGLQKVYVHELVSLNSQFGLESLINPKDWKSKLTELDFAHINDYSSFTSKQSNMNPVYDKRNSTELQTALQYFYSKNLLNRNAGLSGTASTPNDYVMNVFIDKSTEFTGNQYKDINKKDYVMLLMKITDGIEYSRPILLHSKYIRDNNIINNEPIEKSPYKSYMKDLNLDSAENQIVAEYTTLGRDYVYQSSNVYELYFEKAIKNGILSLEEFKPNNQFVVDFIVKDLTKNTEKAYIPRWDNISTPVRLYRDNNTIAIPFNIAKYSKLNEVDMLLGDIDINATTLTSKIKEDDKYVKGSLPLGYGYTYNINGNSKSQFTHPSGFNLLDQVKKVYDRYNGIDEVNTTSGNVDLSSYLEGKTSVFDTMTSKPNINIQKLATADYFEDENISKIQAYTMLYKALLNADEPRLSDIERDAINNMYGINLVGLTNADKDIISYLIAKGLIDVKTFDSFSIFNKLTADEAYMLLYRYANPNARLTLKLMNYPEITAMNKLGYVKAPLNFNVLNTKFIPSIKTNALSSIRPATLDDYSDVYVRLEKEYMKPLSEESASKNKDNEYTPSNSGFFLTKGTNLTPEMFASEDIEVTTSNGKWYFKHYKIPKSTFANGTSFNYNAEGEYTKPVRIQSIDSEGIYFVPDMNDSINTFNYVGLDTTTHSDESVQALINYIKENGLDTKISMTKHLKTYFAGESKVEVYLDKAYLTKYKYKGVAVIANNSLNADFKTRFNAEFKDISVTSSMSTDYCKLTFTSKLVTSKAIINLVMNRITLYGVIDAKTTKLDGYINYSTEDNSVISLISENELGKLGIEILPDKENSGRLLRNSSTDATAYLNEVNNVALIGNDIKKFKNKVMVLNAETKTHYYNIDVICSLLNIRDSSSSLNNNEVNINLSNAMGIMLGNGTVYNRDSSTKFKTNDILNKYLQNTNANETGIATVKDKQGNTLYTFTYDYFVKGDRYVNLSTFSKEASNFYVISDDTTNSLKKYLVSFIPDTFETTTKDLKNATSSYSNLIKEMTDNRASSLTGDSLKKAKRNMVINNTLVRVGLNTASNPYLQDIAISNDWMSKPTITIMVDAETSGSDGILKAKVNAYANFIDDLTKAYNETCNYPFGNSKAMVVPMKELGYSNSTDIFNNAFKFVDESDSSIESALPSKLRMNNRSKNPFEIRFVIFQKGTNTYERSSVLYPSSNYFYIGKNDNVYLDINASNTTIRGYVKSVLGKSVQDVDIVENDELSYLIQQGYNKYLNFIEPINYLGLADGDTPIEALPNGTNFSIGNKTFTINNTAKFTTEVVNNEAYENNNIYVELLGKSIVNLGYVSKGKSQSEFWKNYFDAEYAKGKEFFNIANIANVSVNPYNGLGSSDSVARFVAGNNLLTKDEYSSPYDNLNVDKQSDKLVILTSNGYKLIGTSPIINTTPVTNGKYNINSVGALNSNINQAYATRPRLLVKYGTMVVNSANQLKVKYTGNQYVAKLTPNTNLVGKIVDAFTDASATTKYLNELPEGAVLDFGNGIKFMRLEGLSTGESRGYSYVPTMYMNIYDASQVSSLGKISSNIVNDFSSIALAFNSKMSNIFNLNTLLVPSFEEYKTYYNSLKGLELTNKQYNSKYFLGVESLINQDNKPALLKSIKLSSNEITNSNKANAIMMRADLYPLLKFRESQFVVNGKTIKGYKLVGIDDNRNINIDGVNDYVKKVQTMNSLFAENDLLWNDYSDIDLVFLQREHNPLKDMPISQQEIDSDKYNQALLGSESLIGRLVFVICLTIIGYCLIIMAILIISMTELGKTIMMKYPKLNVLNKLTFGRFPDLENIDYVRTFIYLGIAIIVVLLVYAGLFTSIAIDIFKAIKVILSDIKDFILTDD